MPQYFNIDFVSTLYWYFIWTVQEYCKCKVNFVGTIKIKSIAFSVPQEVLSAHWAQLAQVLKSCWRKKQQTLKLKVKIVHVDLFWTSRDKEIKQLAKSVV